MENVENICETAVQHRKLQKRAQQQREANKKNDKRRKQWMQTLK